MTALLTGILGCPKNIARNGYEHLAGNSTEQLPLGRPGCQDWSIRVRVIGWRSSMDLSRTRRLLGGTTSASRLSQRRH